MNTATTGPLYAGRSAVELDLNAAEVTGRKVGIPGVATGTIIEAGWACKAAVVRLDCDGTPYNTLVMGYIVRWDIDGRIDGPMPLDRLRRSDLLPV